VTPAALVMACVAATSALGGGIMLARRARTPQGVYGKRIAATMALSFALILALFAWGLERAASGTREPPPHAGKSRPAD